MISNISPVFAALVEASPPGDRVLAPIALYDALATVSRSFNGVNVPDMARVKRLNWVRSYLIAATNGRSDSVKLVIPEALAMMMGVEDVLFPKPSMPEIMGPRAPRKWLEDLDRVLSYVVAHPAINSKGRVATTRQGRRPDHSTPALAA